MSHGEEDAESQDLGLAAERLIQGSKVPGTSELPGT